MKSTSPVDKLNEIHGQLNNQNLLATESTRTINLPENELSKNLISNRSSFVSLVNNDNNSPNYFPSDANNFEKQNSISPTTTLTDFPIQFSFESVSSELSDKMTTLFQPKNERQTFI